MTKTFINWFDRDRNVNRDMSTPHNQTDKRREAFKLATTELDELVKASDTKMSRQKTLADKAKNKKITEQLERI